MSNQNKGNFLNVYRMTFIALFAALMVVCSWIAVPSPFAAGVPFTLQTFAIIAAGLVLSPVEALLSTVVYFLLGVVGLPIFAGFTTLYSKIGAPAGGFVIGFFITPVIISLVKTAFEKMIEDSSLGNAAKNTLIVVLYIAVAIILGILLIDIPGVIQFKYVTNSPWDVSIFSCALSFMPTDILKCVLAAIVAAALRVPLKKLMK